MSDTGTDPTGRLFAFLDADGDGCLRWPDYQRLAERILREYRLSDDDPRAVALRTAYALYWRELLSHTDSAGEVDEKAFFIAHYLANSGPLFQGLNGIVHAVLTIARTGPENVVDEEGLVRLLSVLGIAGPAAKEAFARLDSDRDGRVGCAEFVRAAEQFFLAADHTAPGAVLFGMCDPAPPAP